VLTRGGDGHEPPARLGPNPGSMVPVK
jgi:hypothetical protein